MPPKRSVADRLHDRVTHDEDGCWRWHGEITVNGYGRLRGATGRNEYAHRVSYQLHVGPIPEGLDLDHLCRVRSCVNPDHLEPVTRAENIRRGAHGDLLPDTCPQGHPRSEYGTLNSKGAKVCRACQREWERTYDRTKRKRTATA